MGTAEDTRQEQEATKLHCISNQEAEGEWDGNLGCKPSKPAPCDPLPPARCQGAKGLATSPLAGDQMLEHINL